MSSSESPVGYLFTDIEGSVERWERAPTHMQVAAMRLDSLIGDLIERHGGVIQDRAGDGLLSIFRAGNPLECAVEIQLEVQRMDWSAVGGLDVRIGVHASKTSVEFERAVVNRAARIVASGWGGQIVVSRDALESYVTPADVTIVDQGMCRFKGVAESLHLGSLLHPLMRRKEFPPLRSLLFDGPVAVEGPMFGRQRELSDVLSKIQPARLLTILGPGGSGKTRLALQVAAEVASSTPVCFVSLDEATEASGFVRAIASALRLQPSATRDVEVFDYLEDKRLLLVLDGAEVIAGRTASLEELLAVCENVIVLATSREPLGVTRETLVHLSGLALAEDETSPALQLLLHEARLRTPEFQVDNTLFPLFERIHKLVDGSPLALRLIAEWTALLTLEEIHERLTDNFTLLDPPPGGDGRQSLSSVFEGSWRLLTPKQQVALVRLSIFSKSFDSKAALNIIETNIETLAALERKGLIVRSPNGGLSMHAMIRRFARARLSADEEEAVQSRHAVYYLGVVRSCMEGVAQRAAIEQLRRDFDEVRAAWKFGVFSNSDALIATAIEPLCYFLYMSSMLREAVELFGFNPQSERLRGYFTSIRANFLVHQGDVEGAGAAAASVLAAPGGHPAARAFANFTLANLAHIRGEFDEANAYYERAYALREEIGDLRGCWYASISLGALHLLYDRLDGAREHIKRGYRMARQGGDAFAMMAAHIYAGDLAALEVRLDDARENYGTALKLEESISNTQFRSMLQRRLGTLFATRGDLEAAVQHHKAAHDLARDVGDERTRAHALIEVGSDLRLLKDFEAARQNLVQGVRLSIALGMRPNLSRGLLELAHVEMASDNMNAARRIASALERSDLREQQVAYDALVAELRGGDSSELAPITILDLVNELIAEAEVGALKL